MLKQLIVIWNDDKTAFIVISLILFSSVHSLISVRLFVTPWTVAHQALLSMEFSKQETGVGSHSLFQGIFLTRVSKPCTAGRFFTIWATKEAPKVVKVLVP